MTQRRRLALLALLGAAGDRGWTRDKLVGLLWPETSDDQARRLLSDSLYVIRQALGEESVITSGEVVRLNPEVVKTDVVAFREALTSGELERAAESYGGPFLSGFYVGDAVELEHWVDGERERLAGLYAKALETLAQQADDAGDAARAVEWWKKLAAHDPYNSQVALRLMEALVKSGNPAGALEHARVHELLVREELGAEPAEELRQVVEQLKRQTQSDNEVAAEVAAAIGEAGAASGAPFLIREVHRRSLWQVGLFYLGGAWACYEIIGLITRSVGLPGWVPSLGSVVLLFGLPFVLATAFVQGGGPFRRQVDRAAVPEGGPSIPASASIGPRWLNWRNALLTGVGAFALLGMATAGYMAMRTLGIGPPATMIAKGVLEEQDVIVLADFEGDSAYADLVTEVLRVDLGQSPALRLAEQDYVTRVLRQMERERGEALTYELAHEIAIREGLKAVVAGEIKRAGLAYVLTARLVPTDGSRARYFRETARDSTEIIDAIDMLSKGVRERIGESLKSIRAGEGLERVTTSSLEALLKYTLGVRAYEVLGEQERGRAQMREAIALDTTFAMAYRKLGVYENIRSRRMEALEKAYQYSHRLPDRERYLALGTYYQNVGRREEAINAYRSLLEIHPNEWIALNNLALEYVDLKQFAKAESLFMRVVELVPPPPGPINLIVVQTAMGKFDEAVQTLQRWSEATPGNSRPLLHRAELESARGNYSAAESLLVKWRDDRPEDPFRREYTPRNLARLARVQGKLASEEKYVRESLKINDKSGRANRYRSGIIQLASSYLWHLGDTAKALKTVKAALDRYPLESSDPLDRGYLGLAGFYAYAGQADRAREFLVERENYVSDEDPTSSPVRLYWGVAALAEGRAEEALAEYRIAERNDVDACTTCYPPQFAYAYEAAGKPDSAIIMYERYLATPFIYRLLWGIAPTAGRDDFWLPLAYERLGDLYEQRGDTAKAIHYYGKFVDLWRDADPELQPRVEAARRAMEVLSHDS